ncbi:MAG: hypothetical protein WDZ91_07790 [Paenibacillaceae bacterium]
MVASRPHADDEALANGHWAFGDVEESTRSHEVTRKPDSSEQLLER